MPSSHLETQMRAVFQTAARQAGLRTDGAFMLGLHSNAIFVVPDPGLVVRIATNPDALPAVTAAVRVTQWLADRGFPCTVPADIAGQPVIIDGRVVTFWRYLATGSPSRPSAADLGRLLRELHASPLPPQPPPPLTDPLSSVAAAVTRTPEAMPQPDRVWLRARIADLRTWWQTARFPHPACLIHGDAHGNNLIQTLDGTVVLGDWDHVSTGPREWDLVQPHYTHRRFHRPAATDLDAFANAYGWEVRDYPELGTLIAIRELSGLAPYIRTATDNQFSAAELTHRLATLRHAQDFAPWTPPQR
jgi:aminoglycoside phosphotransferase (APT) family kinase protein